MQLIESSAFCFSYRSPASWRREFDDASVASDNVSMWALAVTYTALDTEEPVVYSTL